MSYRIVRNYLDRNIPARTIKRGLTLEEVQAYCGNPETSSSTATSKVARERTKRLGPWFDGYTDVEKRSKRRW